MWTYAQTLTHDKKRDRRRSFTEDQMLRVIPLFFLPACSLLDRVVPVAAPTESVLIEMCRDDPMAAKSLADTALQNGWRYAGPAYNNGINCTDTIWIR